MEITELQLDSLKEIINIGVGRSAASLNKILNKRISLQVPDLHIIEYENIKYKLDKFDNNKLSIIKMPFIGNLTGIAELVFSTNGASKIVKILTDEAISDEALNDQIRKNALTEVGNIILNALVGTIGNLLKTRMQYSIPKYFECDSEDVAKSASMDSKWVIYAETVFKIVDEDIIGSFILFLEVESFDNLLLMLTEHLNMNRQ
jgi:chemotaxis protein CheC